MDDISEFSIPGPKFDGAYCTVDTFRHLLSDKAAIVHLRAVNKHLKKYGIYIIGLHVLPEQGVEKRVYRWSGRRGFLKVSTSITCLDVSTAGRRETLRYNLYISKPSGKEKFSSIYKLRTYTLSQFNRLVSLSGCFDVISVYDVDGGFAGPVVPDSTSENLAFVLMKTGL